MPEFPLILAHRGGKFWEGKNFSYISDSIRDGADIIELDVRMRNGKYMIQHMPWDEVQGTLEDALMLVGSSKLYLDIKTKIDINEFIYYVRSKCPNDIIIGTYDLDMLRSIKDEKVIRNCHCIWPWSALSRGRYCKADWINMICYTATESLAKKIQEAGFKFIPSGNQIFKKREIMNNQVKYSGWGAHLISTHHVKKMRELLLVKQETEHEYGK